MEPFEIICAPYTVYKAPVSTVFPDVGVAPAAFAAGWKVVGTSGNKNYTEEGVTVTHSQTFGEFVPAGGTMPRKAWRQTEGLVVAFALADLSLEQYAVAMDDATVNTQPASGGKVASKWIDLTRGVEVSMAALLVRGISPYDETKSAQYQLPSAYQAGNPAPRFSKQGAAELAVEFHYFELDPNVAPRFQAATTP